MPWELRSCDNMDPVAGLGSLLERSVDVVITDPLKPLYSAGTRA